MIAEVGLWVFVGVISSLVVWKGSFWLEDASENLCTYYRLPYIVKGAVVTAFGSSFPEVSSVVLATVIHGEFDLGVGSVVGSAIFNILVIPAVAGLYFKSDMELSRKIADKEAKFYMVSVSAIIILFCLAVIYNPVESSSEALKAYVSPYLALIPIMLYLVYIFDQWQEVKDSDDERENVELEISVWKQWGLLLSSLLMIGAGIEALVRSVLFFGEISGVPSFILGAVIVAGVTSAPDTIVSIRQSRAGQGVASLANVFGSNTFDLLIAVPAGIILAGGAVVNFSASIILLSILVGVTVIVFVVIRTGLDLKRSEGYLLLGIYAVFVIWISLEAFSITEIIPS